MCGLRPSLAPWLPALVVGCLSLPPPAFPSTYTIDPAACAPDTYVDYREFGSVSITIVGPVEAGCEIQVNAEVEGASGPPVTCYLPRDLGTLALDTEPGTPFLAPIAKYCEKN
jgi:hypothetical protein